MLTVTVGLCGRPTGEYRDHGRPLSAVRNARRGAADDILVRAGAGSVPFGAGLQAFQYDCQRFGAVEATVSVGVRVRFAAVQSGAVSVYVREAGRCGSGQSVEGEFPAAEPRPACAARFSGPTVSGTKYYVFQYGASGPGLRGRTDDGGRGAGRCRSNGNG